MIINVSLFLNSLHIYGYNVLLECSLNFYPLRVLQHVNNLNFLLVYPDPNLIYISGFQIFLPSNDTCNQFYVNAKYVSIHFNTTGFKPPDYLSK